MLPGIIASIIFAALIFLGYIGVTYGYVNLSIIFEKWIPAAITPASAGIFLVLLIPWINHFYWKRRTQKERQWSDEKLKYEILSNTAEILDGALLHISRLSELEEEEKSVDEVKKTDIRKEIYTIHRDKLELERRIAKQTRLIELFFDESIFSDMHKWIDAYNKARFKNKRFKRSDSLPSRARKILVAMRNEILSKRHD